MNIFDFAIEMEVDGDAFYQKLSNESNEPRLKKIFLRLAQDEQKHRDVFLGLKGAAKGTMMASTTILDDAERIFSSLISESPAIPQSDLGAYKLAMDMEARSVKLYGEAATNGHDPEAKQLFLKIAEEEHKHYLILENLYDYAKAPLLYKGWSGNIPSVQ